MDTTSSRTHAARLISSPGGNGRINVCFQQGRHGPRLLLGSLVSAPGRVIPFTATGRPLPATTTRAEAQRALLDQSVGLSCQAMLSGAARNNQ